MLAGYEVLVPGREAVVALVDAALPVLLIPLTLEAHVGNDCCHARHSSNLQEQFSKHFK